AERAGGHGERHDGDHLPEAALHFMVPLRWLAARLRFPVQNASFSTMGDQTSRPDLRSVMPGPFKAEDLRPGSYYELSEGHPVQCAPSGGRRGQSQLN